MKWVTMADPQTFSDAIRIALQEESLQENYGFKAKQVQVVEAAGNNHLNEVIGLLGKLLKTWILKR